MLIGFAVLIGVVICAALALVYFFAVRACWRASRLLGIIAVPMLLHPGGWGILLILWYLGYLDPNRDRDIARPHVTNITNNHLHLHAPGSPVRFAQEEPMAVADRRRLAH